ncbi:hypothetical protein GGI13_003464, partial [Coemansia sp. RSA 455]
TIKQIDDHEDSNGEGVRHIVYPIVCAVVFGSVLVHGITIPLVLMGKRVKTTLSTSASSVWNQPGRMSLGNLSAWFNDKRQRGVPDDPQKANQQQSPTYFNSGAESPKRRNTLPKDTLLELSLPPAHGSPQQDTDGLFMGPPTISPRHIVILDNSQSTEGSK